MMSVSCDKAGKKNMIGTHLGEDEVNLFQRASSSLRVEEVDHWDEESIDNSEEEVAAPRAGRGERRREHDDGEVP